MLVVEGGRDGVAPALATSDLDPSIVYETAERAGWRTLRAPVEWSSGGSASRMRAAVDNAVVIADSHGDAAQAAKILAGALARDTTAMPEERREAEEYLAELRERLAG